MIENNSAISRMVGGWGEGETLNRSRKGLLLKYRQNDRVVFEKREPLVSLL